MSATPRTLATPAPLGATSAIRAHVVAGGVERPITESLHTGSATDLQVKLARLADVLAEVSVIVHELSSMVGEIRLASHTERALISSVEKASRPRRLLTVNDLAEMLRVEPRTVRRMRARGELPPAIDFHSVLRWDEPTVQAWIDGRRER